MTGLLIILFLGFSQLQQHRHQIQALKQALARFKINVPKQQNHQLASTVVDKGSHAKHENSGGTEEAEEPEIKGEWL